MKLFPSAPPMVSRLVAGASPSSELHLIELYHLTLKHTKLPAVGLRYAPRISERDANILREENSFGEAGFSIVLSLGPGPKPESGSPQPPLIDEGGLNVPRNASDWLGLQSLFADPLVSATVTISTSISDNHFDPDVVDGAAFLSIITPSVYEAYLEEVGLGAGCG